LATDVLPAQAHPTADTPTSNRHPRTPAVYPTAATAAGQAVFDQVLKGPPAFPEPALTYLDLLVMQYHVRGAGLYFEWGSGGSTSLLAPLARHAWSVDNNKEWCDSVAARPDVAFVRVHPAAVVGTVAHTAGALSSWQVRCHPRSVLSLCGGTCMRVCA
jgi:hypothetical protein